MDTLNYLLVLQKTDRLDGQRSPLCFRPADCLALIENGTPASHLGELLAAADAEEIFREARHLAKQWMGEDSLPEIAGGVDLSRIFHTQYWELAVEVLAFEKALFHQKKNLAWYRTGKLPETHDQLVNPVSLGDWLCSRAQELGQPFVPLGNPPLHESRTGPSPLRRAVSSLKSRLSHFLKPAVSRISGRHVIAWGDSYDALIAMPRALDLASRESLPLLWVGENLDASTGRTGLRFQPEFSRFPRVSPPGRMGLRPTQTRKVSEAFSRLRERVKETELGQRWNLDGYLAPLEREFFVAAERALAMNNFLARFQGSSIVLSNFNGVHERLLEQLAPRHDIHICGITHGWLQNLEGYTYRASEVLVPGPIQKALLSDFLADFSAEFLGPTTTVRTAADPVIQRVASAWTALSSDEQSLQKNQIRSRYGIRARRVIVVLTTMARNRALNELSVTRLENCWDEILSKLREDTDTHVIAKSHPKFNYNSWLKSRCAILGVSAITVTTDPLEDVIGAADIVVDLGFPGTATLATLAFEKPLLLYEGLYRFHRDLTRKVFDSGAFFTVRSVPEMWERWSRLDKDESFRKNLFEENQRLRMELSVPGERDSLRAATPRRSVRET